MESLNLAHGALFIKNEHLLVRSQTLYRQVL